MFKKLINKTIIKNILFMIVLCSTVLFLSKVYYSTPTINTSHQNVSTTNKINSDNTGQIPIGSLPDYKSVDATDKSGSIFGGGGEVNTIFQDQNTNTLYVGGFDLGGDRKHSFYSSQDGGKTWNSVDAKEDGQSIFDRDGGLVSTMFQDENTKTLYVGGVYLGRGGKHSFYSSHDDGTTWNSVDANGKDGQSIFNRGGWVFTMFQDDKGTLYVGGEWIREGESIVFIVHKMVG